MRSNDTGLIARTGAPQCSVVQRCLGPGLRGCSGGARGQSLSEVPRGGRLTESLSRSTVKRSSDRRETFAWRLKSRGRIRLSGSRSITTTPTIHQFHHGPLVLTRDRSPRRKEHGDLCRVWQRGCAEPLQPLPASTLLLEAVSDGALEAAQARVCGCGSER